MGRPNPPCENRKCEYFGKNRYVEAYEQEKTWSFLCTACRKSLRVLTKEGYRKDPKIKGIHGVDNGDPETTPGTRRVRL